MNTTTSNQLDEQIFAIVQRELSTQRRSVQRLALLGAIIMTGVVTALWTTEQRPLPMRLHISFAVMSAIGFAWISVLGNILVRKNCPTSWDRISTAWASLTGGIAFTIVSTVICAMRSEPVATIVFAVIGSIFISIAAVNTRNAHRWQADLRNRIGQSIVTES
ncbi:MAG: hypothetical protein AAF664_23275 [Planctomycetota bacterium]